MGLTKQYLRYVPSANFNIVNHPDCNVIFVTLNDVSDRFVAVGACENVIIWDMRLSEIVMTIENEDMKNNTLKKITVVKLATASQGKHIAVGYCDGSVNTFDLSSGGNLSGTFQGHRSAITALTYDAHGHMLASASKVSTFFYLSLPSENIKKGM